MYPYDYIMGFFLYLLTYNFTVLKTKIHNQINKMYRT